jgi:hypothetical protein
MTSPRLANYKLRRRSIHIPTICSLIARTLLAVYEMDPSRKRQKVSSACERCRSRKLGVCGAACIDLGPIALRSTLTTDHFRSAIENARANYVSEPA